MHEKTVTLVCEAGEALYVEVEFAEGVRRFAPEEFSLVLGDLAVEKHPRRHPCKITLGGVEPNVRSLRIRFAEGEVVWCDMRFMPEIVYDCQPSITVGGCKG